MLQSCLHNIKFIYFHTLNELLASSIEMKIFYLACNTYITYIIFKIFFFWKCCIRIKRSYIQHTHIYLCKLSLTWEIFIISMLLILKNTHVIKYVLNVVCKNSFLSIILSSWSQIRILAELKHINKQRKRNQLRLP